MLIIMINVIIEARFAICKDYKQITKTKLRLVDQVAICDEVLCFDWEAIGFSMEKLVITSSFSSSMSIT